MQDLVSYSATQATRQTEGLKENIGGRKMVNMGSAIKNQKKLKNLVTPELRISLYQTAMNNSGRNFEGKRVTAKAMGVFTSEIYKLAVKEIENIGELSIRQIESTIKPEPTKKNGKRSDVKSLMNKIKKGKK